MPSRLLQAPARAGYVARAHWQRDPENPLVDTVSVEQLAEQVRSALATANLEGFEDLLDPQVTWGAPGDPAPACQNRRQVLVWYANAQAAGVHAEVIEVTTHGNKILLATSVRRGLGEPSEPRWQVLTVADGRIVDIRGYDGESEARTAVGAPEC